MLVFYLAAAGAAVYFLITKKFSKKAVLLVLAGSIMAFVLGVYSFITLDRQEIKNVERDEKGGSGKLLNMEVQAFKNQEEFDNNRGIKRNMDISISSVGYSPQELKSLEKKMWKELYPLIKGDNTNLDHVDKPLYFPSYVEGYPFEINWSTSQYTVLNNDGTIGDEASQKGTLVEIKAVINADDQNFEAQEIFSAFVYPSVDEESYFRRLGKMLARIEKENRLEKLYSLPASFEGRHISYTRKTKDNGPLIFIVCVLAGAAIIKAEKDNEEKRKKERLDAMEQEYPLMVSKISMFAGAGLTISGAFKKMALDYSESGENNLPLYDEILITEREIENGISERKAWRNMGNRCRMPCVVRFCALLIQYSQSGAAGLRAALGAETDQALKDRRERAKRLGEEAGTKLLFPMIMMLAVIMAVIMIPAFTSFGL